jgi:hypothetical protein
MSNRIIVSLQQVRDGMPGIVNHGNKPRSAAQILTVAANRLNRRKHERGETIGFQPADGWEGLTSWPIEVGADGKPLSFKIMQSNSPVKREVDTFLDSLGDLLPNEDEDADADYSAEDSDA